MKETKEKETKAKEKSQQATLENPIEEKGEDKKETSPENSLENELTEAEEKYLRLYSEFENFRRRTSKEKLDLISTANKNLMTDLLPVLDDFERAMVASSNPGEDIKTLREGITLIQNKLNKLLENKGLKKMEVKKGNKFNDDLHEAITQMPSEKNMEGKIIDVVEPGYSLDETVVRFAKVVVGAKQ